jgi:membrane-bound inhibitor of C-type lysozyme
MFQRKVIKYITAGAAAIAIGGGAYGIASAASSSGSASNSSSPPGGPRSGSGSNARSGPASGGVSGTVTKTSTAGFTLKTSAGQTATVTETSATTYQKRTSPVSATAITTSQPVLVLGTTDNTTITATQVTIDPAGSGPASAAAKVIPFTRGAPTTSKQVGQIPADYTEASGTIVSGTAANKATEAALAAYPGGIVDRVVKLSNGNYEVHYIGVNWPHHVFVSQNFKVTGAD